MNQAKFRQIISGKLRSPAVTFLRGILLISSLFYSIIVRLRNFSYNIGLQKQHDAAAVVISIGNITAGGTGKTPLVIWLVRQIAQNYKCVILTRGYKAEKQAGTQNREFCDELSLFQKSCPAVPVIVNSDRVAGAKEAVEKYDAEVLVLDDAFQHRRLKRNLDIVAIDATVPFGYKKILPAGLLREPISSLKRAHAVIITRSEQVSNIKLLHIEERIKRVNPNVIFAKAIHQPVNTAGITENEISPEEIKGKKVFAFCGIGNPDAFFRTLKKTGANLTSWQIYDDHYHYTKEDIEHIIERAEYLKCEIILTTQKDWSKVANLPVEDNIPMGYLPIEIKFIEGREKISQLIDKTLTDFTDDTDF